VDQADEPIVAFLCMFLPLPRVCSSSLSPTLSIYEDQPILSRHRDVVAAVVGPLGSSDGIAPLSSVQDDKDMSG
jgi:hypothetical protein